VTKPNPESLINLHLGYITLRYILSDTARTYSDYSGPRGGVAA